MLPIVEFTTISQHLNIQHWIVNENYNSIYPRCEKNESLTYYFLFQLN